MSVMLRLIELPNAPNFNLLTACVDAKTDTQRSKKHYPSVLWPRLSSVGIKLQETIDVASGCCDSLAVPGIGSKPHAREIVQCFLLPADDEFHSFSSRSITSSML